MRIDRDVPWTFPANSFIVIEDIMREDPNFQKKIYRLLNKYKRHMNCTVLLISHTILKSGIYEFVQNCDCYTLTKTRSNSRSFYALASHLNLDKKKAETLWESFVESAGKYGYLTIDADSLESTVFSLNMTEDEEKKERLKKRAGSILSSLCDRPQTPLAFFDYLLENFDVNNIAEKDLSINLYAKKLRTALPVSVVDLLFYTSYSEAGDDIPPEAVALLKLLSGDFVIPHVFIRNKHMRIAFRDNSDSDSDEEEDD